MRDQFIKTLMEQMELHPEIILITGDLGFGVLDEFISKYPKNFINSGVAEQNMTGIAAGLALEGKTVFTYSIGNFPTLRCLEQIRNDLCYHNLNVNIVSVGGGFSYGALGISHHATEDLAIMRSLPNITVVSPSTLFEVEASTKAIINRPGTCYLRLDKSKGLDSDKYDYNEYKIGKSITLKDGADCTIIVTGGILEEVQIAANDLVKNNINPQIISMHTIKPIDKSMIKEVYNNTKAIITVEEHTLDGGLGSAVSEVLADNQLMDKPFLRIGLESRFSSIVGSQKYLRKCYKMDSKSIFNRVKSILNR